MLKNRCNLSHTIHKNYALIFAALGDETRFLLVAKLCAVSPLSIFQLTENSKLTRLAITKHLQVLQLAGIVRSTQTGRKNLFGLNPEPIEEVYKYLLRVSENWDKALSRLKSFVEK